METDTIVLKNIMTCPNCGCKQEVIMEDTMQQSSYKCENCGTISNTKKGEHCVYCSYGSVKCPTMQKIEAEICGDFCC